MKLSQLLDGVLVSKMFQTMFGRMVLTHEVEVGSLRSDSRLVQRGDCFVALRGTGADGHRFVTEAIARGATVAVIEDDGVLPDSFFMHAGVVKVVVPNSHQALALMAANFYGNPGRAIRMVGVTGTNGKTTTSVLLRSVLEAAGEPAGLIGTIEYRIGDRVVPASHTTPDPVELNTLLAEMVRAGTQAVAMEVSSHALSQDRVYGLPFNVAVFTNLTQDHLDYHGTMEAYFLAKKKLFDGLEAGSWAIVNADDPWSEKILRDCRSHHRSYGSAPSADVRVTETHLSLSGTRMTLHHDGVTTEIFSPLVGHFNVSNLAAAYAAGLACGYDPEKIRAGLQTVTGVRGRFERLASPKGWTAIIDYAHTPDALEKCLKSLRDLMPQEGKGRIITVFGAGGDRDRTKRPL
ncbi:MAG: UDP-N-acetylmuramoyl-L-alanyl-D-glutamate--2,6-diaminopimelate ligase, partial [Bacteroidota bacterium]